MSRRKVQQQHGGAGAPFFIHNFGTPTQTTYDIMYGVADAPVQSGGGLNIQRYIPGTLQSLNPGQVVELDNGRLAIVDVTNNGNNRLKFTSLEKLTEQSGGDARIFKQLYTVDGNNPIFRSYR